MRIMLMKETFSHKHTHTHAQLHTFNYKHPYSFSFLHFFKSKLNCLSSCFGKRSAKLFFKFKDYFQILCIHFVKFFISNSTLVVFIQGIKANKFHRNAATRYKTRTAVVRPMTNDMEKLVKASSNDLVMGK